MLNQKISEKKKEEERQAALRSSAIVNIKGARDMLYESLQNIQRLHYSEVGNELYRQAYDSAIQMLRIAETAVANARDHILVVEKEQVSREIEEERKAMKEEQKQ